MVVFTVLSLSRSVALFRGVCKDTLLLLQWVVCTHPSKRNHLLPIGRLPRPSGPLPRIPSHCQGSDSSLSPRRQAGQCVCGQRVVSLPQQLPSAKQVRIRNFLTHKFLLIFSEVADFFFLSSWQLHFIQSEFKGQLPQPYAPGPLATQIVPAHMNDQNLEEPTRYVSHSNRHACGTADAQASCVCDSEFSLSGQVDLRQCHYLVDLDTEEETPLEPRYSANKDEWSVIAYKPFLQASRYQKTGSNLKCFQC